ncbi:helix-turn-helix domain-containing protein [Kutzneria buriramensis]|uniref:DNA-binding HxlR family transcriptional regulator n=1 Tax=Kutzneria buriramensis TaxID=1045776 RepID=A0A3E0HZR7_9PSEU|nr:helix-turn-helix domain-containing protein [Kutzneria buriramensis]REH51964.1 DNA-binding HxlR family transcriptional regulator [Kutzneria buriramensis]
MARECSIANALEVIGERWTLLALREVLLGNRRFDQIVQQTGASRDILATRLRKLVEVGLLERRQYEMHPPRYEYHPTEVGQSLHTVLLTLMAWGNDHVTAGPPPTVWEHSCGHELRPQVVCAHCRQEVELGDSRAVRLGGRPVER